MTQECQSGRSPAKGSGKPPGTISLLPSWPGFSCHPSLGSWPRPPFPGPSTTWPSHTLSLLPHLLQVPTGSAAAPVPMPQQGDEAQHRLRRNTSTNRPRPSKGPLTPALWHCSCPTSVEHRGGRNEPLHAPRAGQAWGGAGSPSVSWLAAMLGRLWSPAWGCKLIAGVKGSRRSREVDGAGREGSAPGGTAPLQLSPTDVHSPGQAAQVGGAMLAPPCSWAQPQWLHSGAGGALVTHPHGQCCCLGFPAHPLPAHGGAEQKGWEHGARAACSTTTHPNTACSSAGRETRQGSGLAGHQGSVSASAWQHQAPGDVSTQPPGLRPAVGCCHPPCSLVTCTQGCCRPGHGRRTLRPA